MDCKLKTPFRLLHVAHNYILMDNENVKIIWIPDCFKLEAQIILKQLNGIAEAIQHLQSEVQDDN